MVPGWSYVLNPTQKLALTLIWLHSLRHVLLNNWYHDRHVRFHLVLHTKTMNEKNLKDSHFCANENICFENADSFKIFIEKGYIEKQPRNAKSKLKNTAFTDRTNQFLESRSCPRGLKYQRKRFYLHIFCD